MNRTPTVFEMVHEVLADSRQLLTKQAAAKGEGGIKKEASKMPAPEAPDFDKLAGACEYLADHLENVLDTRSPQEKLAEHIALHNALTKKAEDIAMNPAMDSGAPNPGGPGSAMKAEQTNTPGTSMDAGESGEASAAHQGPKVTTPNEKPTPTSASNAMETNEGMMMPDQPEAVLKQAEAALVLARLVNKGLITKEAATKTALKAVPAKSKVAQMLESAKRKLAMEMGDPAPQISAGTTPELQSIPGVPSAQMQGSEAGQLTPRETAPTSGEGGGRELISSNEAAINATKRQAKSQNKGALAELLTEPAMSAEHDRVLSQSLDNTSSAGVKISAARALLKKLAAASPEIRMKIAALAKVAEEPGMAQGVPGMNPGMPGMEAGMDPELQEMAPAGQLQEQVPPAAISAAMSQVTPEDLAMAKVILDAQQAQAQQAAMQEPPMTQPGVPGIEAPAAPAAPQVPPEKEGNGAQDQMADTQAGGY